MPEKTEELSRKAHRWFQSVATTVVAGMMLWGLQTVSSIDKAQSVILNRLDTIEVQASGNYSAKEAKKDLTQIGDRFAQQDHRMDLIEGRINSELSHRRGATTETAKSPLSLTPSPAVTYIAEKTVL